MLRSVLVALGATEAGRTGQRVAIDLAQKYDARITGLAVLDRDHITGATAVGIGGAAYKQHRDEVKLKEAHDFLERLEQGFEASCENIGAQWQVIEAEGAPHLLLQEESGRHDLLVVGRDTDFHYDEDPDVARMVNHLLQDCARPVLVCPDVLPKPGPIVAAYDGRARASQAIHTMTLLGLAKDQAVHVVAVADEADQAKRMASYPAELLGLHGIDVESHPLTGGRASERILEHADKVGASMIVTGSHSQPKWHDLLLGSTSQNLLSASTRPLFVHH